MHNPKTCSVVIPTINRAEAVCNLVSDLEQQTYSAVEIVVVDQSNEKNDVLASKQRVVYVQTKVQGTTHARNAGVKKATGEVVVFFDDDCTVTDNTLLERTMHFFKEHPDYAGIAYSVKDVNARLNRENQKKGKKLMHVTRSGKILPFAQGAQQDVLAPRGGGMGFIRSAIVAVGGFDHRYTGNAMREETDFSLRIVKQIGPIRYIPELVIIHLGLPSGGSRTQNRLQWYRDFFANELLFQLTHTHKIFLIHFCFRKIRPILACMFYYGKGRPNAILTPLKGFFDGYKRYRKGFIPYSFSK